ncbi:cadherin-23-like protein [Dinothrombium tinctorium]|uniref:Cadherin-23-like protein n=1 Tax=Dinothrombium tinctorium TaxID=1965070 RepID=A0A3S3PL17_9ACAR|nr:cadherin-23-like protein [Dinothrombium tinctorium]
MKPSLFAEIKRLYRLTTTLIWFIIFDYVTASNNFPPRFVTNPATGGSEIIVRVREGPSSLGKEIHRLVGEDPDGDLLTFGVLGALGSDILHIENVKPNQAIVYLRKELDRETRDSYSLVLTLTDGKLGKGNFITKSMLIIVEDINDNEPVFRPFRTSVTLSEESQPGIVETVEAFDQDEGRFGQVLYSLQEIDNENGPNTFSIETVEGRGVISLVGDLDYERKSFYQLKILAIDRAIEGERHTASATLLVRVDDAEDQPPVFIFVPSVTRIPENLQIGSQVLRVIAIDGDRGVNNAITYSITKGARGLFAINSSMGTVTVQDNLDRESNLIENAGNGAYILEIQATEVTASQFPPPSVATEVTIILTDVNDEKPTFKSLLYVAEVNENAQIDMPLKFIGAGNVPQVYDYDQGINGTFTLSLEGYYASFFEIIPSIGVNEATFMIRVKDPSALDYETVKSMDMKLVARERLPIGAQSSVAQLVVQLKDVNDNFPQFEKELYRASVPENAAKGTTVTTIRAIDNDSGFFGTEGVRYTDVQGEIASKLNLDPVSGVLTVKTSDHGFDRETISQYYLTIEARDNNGTGNRNTVQLLLTIDDVDDYEPEFTQDAFRVAFTENVLPNQESFKLLPTVDRDEVGTSIDQAIKSIPCGNEEGNFKLDIFTHQLTNTKSLDREQRGNYTLIVQATNDCLREPKHIAKFDPKDNSLLQVLIDVKDVNDNPPRFAKQVFTGGVTTEMDFGTVFMTVKAVDLDLGANSVINYYIIGPQKKILSVGLDSIKEEPFQINRKTGEISLNFDPQRNMKGHFEFHVLANDTDGLADSAKVKIYLLREDQRVRFVLRLTPYELREKLDKFRNVLGNITGAIVNVDGYKFHANLDGSVDKKKYEFLKVDINQHVTNELFAICRTDLYLYFVNPVDNSIMEVNSVLALIDKNIDYLDELYKEFNVLISEPAESREELLTFDDQIKACLMGSTAFLALLLILVTCLCLNQRNRYERRLKAATVSAFGPRDAQLNRTDVPNTNIHAEEGSNPIWMTGYDNEWFKDDEQISHNSGGNNSLDENAVGEVSNGPLTPTDSLNGSARGSGSDSSTNDRQALCRGVTGGRLTPQNITLPSAKLKTSNNKKTVAPKPPTTDKNTSSMNEDNKISCKNSINTVYISSSYADQSQYHHHANHLGNNLSIMNLETTEL